MVGSSVSSLVLSFLLICLGTSAQYENCTGVIEWIADGSCDWENNDEACDFDGGDCCECTCGNGLAVSTCDYIGFNCLDPNAPSALYNCEKSPTSALPCGANLPSQWSIETTEDAQDLAEAVYCSGGLFEVLWNGIVVVNKTILVIDRTVLRISGVGSNNAIDGGGMTRLFTILNASLYVSDVDILNGNATSGGAIAASGSSLTFTRATISGNTASNHGGGMVVSDASTAVFTGATVFSSNTAAWGGAMAVTSDSNISWEGMTIFSRNHAYDDGGALHVWESSMAWVGNDTAFSDNTASLRGGALYVRESIASWAGNTAFSTNTAGSDGGALYVGLNSISTWSGKTAFAENTATDQNGGAVHVDSGSIVEWSGESTFSNNSAGNGGGAVAASGSTMSWAGTTLFSSNTANDNGGAVQMMDSKASWTGSVMSSSNTANFDGGAFYVGLKSTAIWSGDTSFSKNKADNDGGVVVVDDSTVSWIGNTSFSSNTANVNGGGVCLMGSAAAWVGEATFANNTAGSLGGALYAAWASTIAWTGETRMSNNGANRGGALYEGHDSNAKWSGKTVFSENTASNTSSNDADGGAVYVESNSTAAWSGDTMFSNNDASNSGGAIATIGSNVSWANNASFFNNTSNVNGGAVQLMFDSFATWVGETTFLNNTATFDGGALYVTYSNASWTGKTRLSANDAGRGGALYEGYDSSAVWSGETSFTENTASRGYGGGGAVYVDFGSATKWLGNTLFSRNIAKTNGGAISTFESTVTLEGTVSFLSNTAAGNGGALWVVDSSFKWRAKTIFSQNVAEQGSGGAVNVYRGSTVEYAGDTLFSYNKAGSDGGAMDVGSNGSDSSLIIDGPTVFQNNTCGGNGGGIRISSTVSLVFKTEDITFFGNIATLSGGGVSINAANVGPEFKGTVFIANSAQVGGGVHATDTPASDSAELFTATKFNGCVFVANGASISGGALSSDSGLDAFINTSFVSNYAQMGGGLNLAGTASISNCSFEDNVSEVDGGPAVYNLKVISTQRFNSFVNNVFRCDSGDFLQFLKSDELFETVCAGCPGPCNACDFDEWVPRCSTLSEAGIAHASSPGGDTKIEGLIIEKGYWRATNMSSTVLACYNEDACTGGVTDGTCSPGYNGPSKVPRVHFCPDCSVCSGNYVAGLGSKCTECSDSIVGVVADCIIAAVCIVFGVAVIRYLLSGEVEGMGRGLVDRLTRSIPLQAVKITIVSWQILTQFTSVANVTYPDTYQRFVDGVDILNLDLGWTMSTACLITIDFHDRLLISTIGPIVVIMVLGITYATAVSKHRRSEDVLQNVRHKHVSTVLLLTFMVYSSASSLVFQMFDCEHLEDGNYYLRADYRIECDSSKHRALQVFAGVMMALYPVGIPVLYAFLLFRDRGVLASNERRMNNPSVRSTSNLWKPYKPSRYFYEVVECGRRILLTGVVLMVDDGTAAKIAVTFMVALFFVFVSEALAPYESRLDAWISRAGHAVTSTSIYFALLLEVNVSDESQASQSAFEVVLVIMHVCMISSVLVESGLAAYSLRPRERDVPRRRFWGMSRGKAPVEEVKLDLSVQSNESPTSLHAGAVAAL